LIFSASNRMQTPSSDGAFSMANYVRDVSSLKFRFLNLPFVFEFEVGIFRFFQKNPERFNFKAKNKRKNQGSASNWSVLPAVFFSAI